MIAGRLRDLHHDTLGTEHAVGVDAVLHDRGSAFQVRVVDIRQLTSRRERQPQQTLLATTRGASGDVEHGLDRPVRSKAHDASVTLGDVETGIPPSPCHVHRLVERTQVLELDHGLRRLRTAATGGRERRERDRREPAKL